MAWTDGAWVVDKRSGRVGRVAGQSGPRLRVQPLSFGGRPWVCPPDVVRPATEWEQRNADVLNASWRFWRPFGVARPATASRGGGFPPYGTGG